MKIGIVAFDGTDHVLYPLADYTGKAAQITAISGLMSANSIPAAEHVSGTNMQAGLDRANKILAADTSVQSNRKYVVLVSDGLTRLFSDKNGNVRDIYYQFAYNAGADEAITPAGSLYYGMIGEWDFVRNGPSSDTKPYQVPYGSWSTYFGKVTSWVQADGDSYAMDFSKYGNDATGLVKDSAGNITDANFKFIAHTDYANHAMSVDRAVYEAYNSYKALVNAGYRCYAVNVGDYDFSKAFMGAMNTLSGNSENIDFDTVQNAILYLLASGTVTDEMGDDFDLVAEAGKCPFTLTLDGAALAAVQDPGNANLWNFGTKSAAGVYPYTVEYKPASGSTKEQFVWSINVPVENSHRIELSYNEQLVNIQTAEGEYTVDTNADTYLNYKDSNGNSGNREDFVSPTVTYAVTTIPDDGTPTSAGTTGETNPKTGSGSKMPLLAVMTVSLAALIAAASRKRSRAK